MGILPRSIAFELALLFLGELEPQVADDPERLVSTEAVLSFAAIRHGDPPTWQHWRDILAQYEKLDLVEHMLGEPVPVDVGSGESAADRLIGLVLESGIEFFHDPEQHGWAGIRVDGHWENHPIRSRPFQLFLLRTYYRATGCSPGAQALRAAQDLFEAKALFDGEEVPVHLRVASHGGNLYLDLCDRVWRAVEIDTQGWRIVERPPARFHRTRGSQALPAPERGGSLEELRRFLNVDDQGWILIKAFLVAALRPGVPCPILVAKGEQGSGKTTACRILSGLIDPRTGALRGVPREVRDLVAAARNSWLVCFDNLSHLPDELADAACRLATGGGFGGRQLYSDHDQAIFDATRPLVFNSIPDLAASRPDFLDRAVIIEFPDIKPEMRRDEAQFWREFEEAQPRILGALLDAVTAGLSKLPNVRHERLPRMADFVVWVSACEKALGLETGEALEAYRANRAAVRNLALEASPVYEPLREVARAGFNGTSSELLFLLNKLATGNERRSGRWPKAPNALGSILRRIAGSLRSTGIEIYFSREDHQGRRIVSVKLASLVPERSSAPSASLER
jgi:energy-coupling factor transporter ATP-binding protein EcfA2